MVCILMLMSLQLLLCFLALQPDTGDDVFHSMISVMQLCNAVSNRQVSDNKPSSSAGASPMKKAELHTTYMKQLSDLRSLCDNNILNTHKYEEPRCL